MKVLIFGASGATGKLLVQQALKQGHTVTAFVRNPLRLEIVNSNLKIIKGDVMNTNSVKAALLNQDVVLCCLGAPANKSGIIRSTGTKNIIQAMENAGIQRFICQTSLGFDDSTEVLKQTPFVFKNVIVPFLLKKTFAEHLLQETYIKQSRLDWTIVRPGNLTNGKLTGQYKHGFDYSDKTIKVKIARADVADFMLKQMNTTQYLHQVTGLSY
jgi:putative NADH-flavin reductase